MMLVILIDRYDDEAAEIVSKVLDANKSHQFVGVITDSIDEGDETLCVDEVWEHTTCNCVFESLKHKIPTSKSLSELIWVFFVS